MCHLFCFLFRMVIFFISTIVIFLGFHVFQQNLSIQHLYTIKLKLHTVKHLKNSRKWHAKQAKVTV